MTEGTLEIEPGTVVMGSQSDQGTLIIERGAAIDAVGKPLDPIIFTSEQPAGRRSPGDWGGIILRGAAISELKSRVNSPRAG